MLMTVPAAAAMLSTSAFAASAQDWFPSKWGAEDQLGAANLITPEPVLAAAKMVKPGKTYNLGTVVDSKAPAFPPRSMSVTVLQPNQISSTGLGPTKTTYDDDFFMGWLDPLHGASPDPKRYVSTDPGVGKSRAEYHASPAVMAVGADTCRLEAVSFEDDVGVFEIHQILIPKSGIFVLENMDAREMVEGKAWEFMFVLGVSRLKGAVQMINNPTAIR